MAIVFGNFLSAGTMGDLVPIDNNFTKDSNSSQKSYADGELIIKFKKDANRTAFWNKFKMQPGVMDKNSTRHDYKHIKSMFLQVPGMGADKLKEIIEKMPFFKDGIESIEFNYKTKANESSDDSYYSKLWAVENTGQSVNNSSGTNDADMDVKEAWDKEKGDSDLVVAVLDTGVDYTHNDLADNMWRGAAKHGYDFAGDDDGNNDDDPMPDQSYDKNGHYHGTHVAGTIGAVANNSNGVAGVAQNVQIMAVKVFRPNGYGYTSDILEGMDYVLDKIDNGVKVVAINASYGGSGGKEGDSVEDAIVKLGEKGVIFVAAAGNDGKDIDSDPIYPAAYKADNIIAVAASDQNDKLASFSNWGKESVDLAAPGTNILSTYPENKYAYLNGTSMATPNVVGSVVLLRAHYPDATIKEIKDKL
ncbi:MAG: S8 family peptidase, partial [bacterium]